MGKTQRNSSIELLRIISMLAIITYHFIARQYGLYVIGNDRLGQPKLLQELITFQIGSLGVPCFMFISGYYGIKWRKNRFVDMIAQGAFYSTISIIGLYILLKMFNYKHLCFINEWWFLQAYIIVYLLSSGLNYIVETFNSKKLLYLICFLWFVLFSSLIKQQELGGVVLLSTIYFTARYMNLYIKDSVKQKSHLIFLILLLLQIGLTCLSFYTCHIGFKPLIMNYSNPINTLTVGFLVISTERIVFHSRVINYFASSCLGVYLLSESDLGKSIFSLFFPKDFNMIFFIVASLIVFIFCTVVDKVRNLMFYKIINNG